MTNNRALATHSGPDTANARKDQPESGFSRTFRFIVLLWCNRLTDDRAQGKRFWYLATRTARPQDAQAAGQLLGLGRGVSADKEAIIRRSLLLGALALGAGCATGPSTVEVGMTAGQADAAAARMGYGAPVVLRNGNERDYRRDDMKLTLEVWMHDGRVTWVNPPRLDVPDAPDGDPAALRAGVSLTDVHVTLRGWSRDSTATSGDVELVTYRHYPSDSQFNTWVVAEFFDGRLARWSVTTR